MMCPRCGRVYNGYPAISRDDNSTGVCSVCGHDEALRELAGRRLSRDEWFDRQVPQG
jgi:hypothetical protein